MIFTTNNKYALKIEPGERRHVMFHCSNIHKGDQVYFMKLRDEQRKPEVVRAFYQHLMSRDISRHGETLEGTRPYTDYYNEVRDMYIPIEARYTSPVSLMDV